MAALIEFETSKFDLANETENEFNPIYGESILQWLSEHCSEISFLGAPDTEDWGWYIYSVWNDRQYMVGASAEFVDSEPAWCVVQIHKTRTMKEKLFGKEKLTEDDELVKLISSAFIEDPEVLNVVCTWDNY